MTNDPLNLTARIDPARQIIVTTPAYRIRERFGDDPALAASLMRATANHLLEQADDIDPPMIRRFWDLLTEPTLGEWIGGLCLFATFYLLMIFAGVLS